jgi:CheY-like chemotaxis protein
MNILLADDSVPAQNMGKKILVDAGYSVVTVNNGLEALRRIADSVPDIAILDIFMPGYTGLEICKRLRSSAATAAIPVILTVGKLEPYRPEDGEQVQSNAVIVKPFAAAELISAVRSLIGGPTAEAVASPPQAAAVDPLHESPLGSGSPLAAAPTPQPHLGPFSEAPLEEPDEPLFASAASGSGAAGQAPGVPASEPHGFGASLAFDPDAKRTPFSASAFEPPPAAAENGVPESSEFNLPPEPFYLASHPEVVTYGEPSLPAPPAHEAMQEEATQQEATSETGEPPEHIAAGFTPQDAAAAEASHETQFPSDDLPPEQLSPEEEARRDAFEALFNSPEPLPLDNVPTPSADRDAFAPPEAAEPPQEHASGAVPQHGFASLDRPQYFSAPQPESNLLEPAPVEEMQPVSEPPSAIAASDLLDGQPMSGLLDHALAPIEQPEPATEWKPQEAISPSAVDSAPFEPPIHPYQPVPYQPTPHQPIEDVPQQAVDAPASWLTASSEAAPAPEPAPFPAPPGFAEAPPETPAAFETPAPAEVLPAAPWHPVDAWQSLAEAVPPAVQPDAPHSEPFESVPSEAWQPAPVEVPQPAPEPSPSPELSHPEAGLSLTDTAPAYLEAAPENLESVPVEAVPLEAPSVHPESTTVPEPTEPEPHQLHSEPQTEEIFSPPGLSSRLTEAERIHQAIELVFDRFKPLLVAAIVRELARHD